MAIVLAGCLVLVVKVALAADLMVPGFESVKLGMTEEEVVEVRPEAKRFVIFDEPGDDKLGLELFVEDYEKLISATSKAASIASADRKFIEDTKPTLLQGT